MCTNSKNVRSEDQIKSWHLRDCRLHITGRHLTQRFFKLSSLFTWFSNEENCNELNSGIRMHTVVFALVLHFIKLLTLFTKKHYKDILTRKIGDYILK